MTTENAFARGGRVVFMTACTLICLLAATSGIPIGVLANAEKSNTSKKSSARVLSEEQRIVHLLNRLGYGPRPGDVTRVQQLGINAYIDSQLHPERIADTTVERRLAEFKTLTLTQTELMEIEKESREFRNQIVKQGIKRDENGKIDPESISPEAREMLQNRMESGEMNAREIPRELQEAKLLRAVYSERQLQEVLTDFWMNHFNIFIGKGLDRVFLTSYERDTIRPHIFGKFEDLLTATAESPAMMFYLDNWQSVDPNMKLPDMSQLGKRQNKGAFGKGRNRRLFQNGGNRQAEMPDPEKLQALQNQLKNRKFGLNENYARELLELHTLGVDGGYTQKDVTEVARCFTGWSINRPLNGNRMKKMGLGGGEPGTFIYRDLTHDKGEKSVLGTTIAAGGGKSDGETVLHMLATHPSTAKFISTKLARRLIADQPPSRVVDAAAATFKRTGGDLREVVKTIISAPEFFSAEAYRAKVKTPLELVASSLRATDADIQRTTPMIMVLRQLGMPLYGWQPPTGYPDTADHWVNTGALLNRLNFSLALAGNRIPGVKVNLNELTSGARTPEAELNTLIKYFLSNDISAQTRNSILEGLNQVNTPSSDRAEPSDPDEPPMMRGKNKGEKPFGKGRGKGQLELASLVKNGGPLSETAQLTGLILGSPEFQRK